MSLNCHSSNFLSKSVANNIRLFLLKMNIRLSVVMISFNLSSNLVSSTPKPLQEFWKFICHSKVNKFLARSLTLLTGIYHNHVHVLYMRHSIGQHCSLSIYHVHERLNILELVCLSHKHYISKVGRGRLR